MPFLGLAFSIRYRIYGFFFLLFSVAYGACQRAIYFATLVSVSDISAAAPGARKLFVAVAAGKIILAALVVLPSKTGQPA